MICTPKVRHFWRCIFFSKIVGVKDCFVYSEKNSTVTYNYRYKFLIILYKIVVFVNKIKLFSKKWNRFQKNYCFFNLFVV